MMASLLTRTVPTPAQLQAAAHLGLITPEGITRQEIGELIHEAQQRIWAEKEDAARRRRSK
jgi:hypothetical protein